MDLEETLNKLYAERAELNRVIHELTRLQAAHEGVELPRPRRGRKNMSPEERQVVSDRMRNYWEERRRPKPALPRDPQEQLLRTLLGPP